MPLHARPRRALRWSVALVLLAILGLPIDAARGAAPGFRAADGPSSQQAGAPAGQDSTGADGSGGGQGQVAPEDLPTATPTSATILPMAQPGEVVAGEPQAASAFPGWPGAPLPGYPGGWQPLLPPFPLPPPPLPPPPPLLPPGPPVVIRVGGELGANSAVAAAGPAPTATVGVGSTFHALVLSVAASPAGAAITLGPIQSGPCPPPGTNCIQLTVIGSFSVSGTIVGLPPGVTPTLAIPVSSGGTRLVSCGMAGAAGMSTCNAVVAGAGVFPQAGGTIAAVGVSATATPSPTATGAPSATPATPTATPGRGTPTAATPTTTLVPGTATVTRTPAPSATPTATATSLPLQVTGVTPGEASPGARVSISGGGFRSATEVRFGATPASFTIVSDVLIVATVPQGGLGTTVDVVVRTPSGISAYTTLDQFTYNFGVAGTQAFARPFSIDVPIANFVDRQFVGEFNDSNDFQLNSWGERTSGVPGHSGYDYLVPMLTPVYAVAAGTVTFAGSTAPFFCPPLKQIVSTVQVVIQHDIPGLNIQTVYEHLDTGSLLVQAGQQVTQGQQIALSDNTGCTTGPHLHFQTQRFNPTVGGFVPIDPYGWIGPGPDPWEQDPIGAPSVFLWQDGQAPPLYRQAPGPGGGPPSAPVTISLLRWMGYRDDLNPNNEFVEISLVPANAPSGTLDLSGYTISDFYGAVFQFPSGFVLGQSPVRVFSGSGQNTPTALYWGRSSPVWNNFGDCAFLRNPQGALVSRLDSDPSCGIHPQQVTVNPAGTRAYVTFLGGDFVAEINTATNTIINTVPLGTATWPEGVAVSPNGSTIYVADSNATTVSFFPTGVQTPLVGTIPVGTAPWLVAMAPTPATTAYVTNLDSNSISVINTATNRVTATITLPVGAFPEGIAVNPAGTRLYVATNGTQTLTVVDTANNQVVATIAIPQAQTQVGLAPANPAGVAVTPDGARVYVSDARGENVTVISTATNTVLTAITLGPGANPTGIAVNPNGNQVYVAMGNPDAVAVIDSNPASPTFNTVLGTVNVGNNPRGLAVNPAGTRLYVANEASNSISVLDTTTALPSVVATIPGPTSLP